MNIFTVIILTCVVAFILYAIYDYLRNEPLFQGDSLYQFIFQKSSRNLKILGMIKKMPKFRPNPLIPGPFLKLGLVFRLKHKLETLYDHELFEFKDGGKIALDFYPKSSWVNKHTTIGGDKTPIVIVIPGLSGASNERYVSDTCDELFKTHGYRSIIANRRGYSGVSVSGKRPFSWVEINDLDEIIKYLSTIEASKDCPIYLLGMSLGASFVMYYAGRKGELGQKTKVKGLIAISPLYDLGENMKVIESNRFIDYALLQGMKEVVLPHFESEKFTELMKTKFSLTKEMVEETATCRGYDKAISAPLHLKKTLEEYYEYYSANKRIQHIKIPILCISSLCDPVIAIHAMDKVKMKSNPNFFQLNIRDGGHITFPHTVSNRHYGAMVASKWIQLMGAEKIEKGLHH